ncbi:L,D-transpeptidase family protein [Streptomyces sp. MUM 203J]|uniref:L,D-transpeptidase family protein n=1 Tax=Streptomyces sp. MUM 203J TaxID=2791990 RepID=UPI001F03AC46|nr:L,D-transpeptidase family protein [Streptomyces sp. MUM 203J]MCH0540367.1 L,D-transpeptidase family protein [Streptomyces sp. MUM 203J]
MTHNPAPRRPLLVAALALVLPLTACAAPAPVGEAPPVRDAAPSAAGAPDNRPAAPPSPSAGPAPAEIPGLGPETRAAVPGDAHQAVVVRGGDEDSHTSTTTLYARHPAHGWRRVHGPWPSHNGTRGWTHHHMRDDLRSPVGVYGLTDAGGLLPDPGTRLPYDRGPAFHVTGTGSLGEPLEGSFDYVVAVNYNREPGTSPLDWTRPLGPERGGGIWIHVDHEGPTQGCVSLRRPRMRELLRWLDPEANPVVVMGDARSLAR